MCGKIAEFVKSSRYIRRATPVRQHQNAAQPTLSVRGPADLRPQERQVISSVDVILTFWIVIMGGDMILFGGTENVLPNTAPYLKILLVARTPSAATAMTPCNVVHAGRASVSSFTTEV
jgi:hypothetical protein